MTTDAMLLSIARVPMKQHPLTMWQCPNCEEVIGVITPGHNLEVTSPGVLVEKTRSSWLIHCRCGRPLAFIGQRVILTSTNLRPLPGDAQKF